MMAGRGGRPLATIFFLFAVLVAGVHCSAQKLQSPQVWSLLRLKQLLNDPPALSSWQSSTDFCGAEGYAPSATVVCYGGSVTQLHIIGGNADGSAPPPLPESFSIDAFVTTLTRLPDLKVLTLSSLGLWGPLPAKIFRLQSLEIVNMSSNVLSGELPREISRLSNLQTLILDHNNLTGSVPGWLTSLPLLAVMSLRNNTLSGPLPFSLAGVKTLRTLALSSNNLTGDVPDLSGLTDLEVLDLADNALGPQFPSLGRKIVSLTLRRNRFNGALPAELSSFYLLQQLDVSLNRFVGPFPPALLSLPSIKRLIIAGNRFTGMLFSNMTCGDRLEFVDISSNLMTGSLPNCLRSSSDNKTVLFAANCLGNSSSTQHPPVFCQNQALAVGIVLPQKMDKASPGKHMSLMVGIIGAAAAAAFVAGLTIHLAVRKAKTRSAKLRPPRTLTEHVSSSYPSNMLADARYISQTVKLGALGIPAYRTFSLVELEAATNNFETTNLIGQDMHGQIYRGRLTSGTAVTIRFLKVRKHQTPQSFNRHIELISKLRHRHLVSALGHCFEYNLDDSTVTRICLVFEHVSNGNLRSRISHGVEGQRLTWTQRVSAAIGVAKGIQFLHGGIMPGFYGNNLRMTNVLLDQNLLAKISCYHLPLLAENTKLEGGAGSKEAADRTNHEEKTDMFDFGVILLEIVCGRPITSPYEVGIMKDQLQTAIYADTAAKRKGFADPALSRGSSDESLKTVMEICLRCLSKEPVQRPSVEDVLWNLQFAAQVQEAWRGDSMSSEEAPTSPSQNPNSFI